MAKAQFGNKMQTPGKKQRARWDMPDWAKLMFGKSKQAAAKMKKLW
jgi:hypothetical protein